MVRCSTAPLESTLFVLDLLVHNFSEPAVDYLSIDFPREAVESDALIVAALLLVPLFEDGDHHLGLPILRHFYCFPGDL